MSAKWHKWSYFMDMNTFLLHLLTKIDKSSYAVSLITCFFEVALERLLNHHLGLIHKIRMLAA